MVMLSRFGGGRDAYDHRDGDGCPLGRARVSTHSQMRHVSRSTRACEHLFAKLMQFSTGSARLDWGWQPLTELPTLASDLNQHVSPLGEVSYYCETAPYQSHASCSCCSLSTF